MTARQAGATTAAARWTWVDLRLAPVAATVWLTSLVAPWLAPALLFCVAGAASCVAAAVGRRRGTATATVVLAVLAAAVVTSGIAATRGAAREASPLRAAAEAGRTALVQLELDSDPRPMPAAGPPRVVADATVTLLSDDASTARCTPPSCCSRRRTRGRGCCQASRSASGCGRPCHSRAATG